MKKGFTLIEVLAVIVLLGILITLGVPVIEKAINKSRTESVYVEDKIVIDAAKRYIIDYDITIETSNTVSIKALKEAGYLKKVTLENKKTKENLDNARVLVTWNDSTNQYYYAIVTSE